MGADDTGIYFHKNYKIPDSIPIEELFRGISILIVLVFQQIDNYQSENDQFAFSRHQNGHRISYACL
ncbi:MAG: hypothetical protein HVN34_10075 [Methanobacteriaceae archaeon]|jgi:hypothetical protein|nr:hypothetical protein [Methanobacteriaceae archaeon]OPY21436.1 MAG: hypothetical protein A4E26_01626 [Methanobacterium sp. PtaU1.Bin097]